jgi:Zn-dependent protease
VDRARLVSSEDYDPQQPAPRRPSAFRRLLGPLVAGAIALAKWSFVLLKFASIFIAVAAYALIWGWKFAVGFVGLILVHELGHYLEAKREGLHPRLPVFVPFIGAYVQYTRGHPWQTARVALAGPIVGGAASLVLYLVSRSNGSQLLSALAYSGFLINLFNLLPFGILDGGQAWRSAHWLRVGGGAAKSTFVYALYFATAAGLVFGMVAAHVEQTRL